MTCIHAVRQSLFFRYKCKIATPFGLAMTCSDLYARLYSCHCLLQIYVTFSRRLKPAATEFKRPIMI